LASSAAHPAAFLFDGWEQDGLRAKARYWGYSLFPAEAFMRERDPVQGRRNLAVLYLLRLGRGLYRIPRALGAGVAQLLRAGASQSPG
jgi:hypothetical protein